jgi:hypothetical protein
MKKKVKHEIEHFTPIVSDGLVATRDLGEGRLIPVLIIDCKKNRSLFNLIQIHQETPPGDVQSVWGLDGTLGLIYSLILNFSNPAETTAVIPFHVDYYGSLIDAIHISHGLILQPSEIANTVSEGIGLPKIFVEIPTDVVIPNWNKVYTKRLIKKFKKEGLNRKDAKNAAEKHLSNSRRLLHRNLPL